MEPEGTVGNTVTVKYRFYQNDFHWLTRVRIEAVLAGHSAPTQEISDLSAGQLGSCTVVGTATLADGVTPVEIRERSVEWDTTGLYNAAYTLRVTAWYDDPWDPGGDDIDGNDERNLAVRNLCFGAVTTSANNPDYFLFDPAEGSDYEHPTVTFEIKDEGQVSNEQGPYTYEWAVWAVATNSTDPREDYEACVLGERVGPGQVTAYFNDLAAQTANGQQEMGALATWGSFTFEIWVKEVPTNDERWYRLPQVTWVVDGDLWAASSDEGRIEWRYRYRVTDAGSPQSAPSALTLELYGPDLALMGSAQGPTALGEQHTVTLYTYDEGDYPRAGTYICVIRGADSHGTTGPAPAYRDRQNRRLLAVNGREGQAEYPAAVFSESGVSAEVAGYHRGAQYYDQQQARWIPTPYGIKDPNKANKGWKHWDGDAWQYEEHGREGVKADEAGKVWGALRRVAVFMTNQNSVPQGRGLEFSHLTLPRVAIATDHSDNHALLDRALPITRAFYVSDLPADALSNLTCALILCCHDDWDGAGFDWDTRYSWVPPGGGTPPLAPLIRALSDRGAGWVGGVAGGHLYPGDVAWVSEAFFRLAGFIEGDPNQTQQTMTEALKEAVFSRGSQWSAYQQYPNDGPFVPYAVPWQSGGLVPAQGGLGEQANAELGGLTEPQWVTGQVRIWARVDSVNGPPLSGAVVTIIDEDATESEPATTGTNGTAVVAAQQSAENMPYLVRVDPPTGYRRLGWQQGMPIYWEREVPLEKQSAVTTFLFEEVE